MLSALLLWCGFVLAFTLGLILGSALQARRYARYFRTLATPPPPDLTIVKGFDDDD